jgi:hypothetical protein
MKKDIELILRFLKMNQFDFIHEDNYYYFFIFKKAINISIAKNGEGISFYQKGHNFLIIPCNVYALLGALIQLKLITINYKWP